MEGQPGGFEPRRGEYTPSREDLTIARQFEDPEAELALQRETPVTWLRGAIALGSNRYATQIPDAELAERYVGGGIHEWDPPVAKAVYRYLINQGFVITP